MAFTSGAFIALIGAALVVYYLIPQKARWLVLLAANTVFYLAGGVKTAVYLCITILSTYAAGLILGILVKRKKGLAKEDKKSKEPALKRKMRFVAAFAVVLNFAMLYVLKYWDFTAETIGMTPLGLVLPLGVSFYIFQSVGYVIDCYRGKFEPERNLLKYALFVSFFPQMVQGPISRFHQLAPQLIRGNDFDAENLRNGILLALWGFFKKMVVADRAAILVNTVFADYTAFSGAMSGVAVLFYCIELYCDFSGGIDITRGVAKMFGIDMIENFRRPIFAVSLADYWRRWHISLGQWMKDYVFYPLSLSKPFMKLGRITRKKIGGKLGKIIPTSLATFIIYFIIGIWHGANFRFVAYGFWNGAIITASLLLAGVYGSWKSKLNINDESAAWHIWQIVRTWIIVFIGRYITRAPRLLSAGAMLIYTFAEFRIGSLWSADLFSVGMSLLDYCVVIGGVLVILIIEFYQEKGGKVRQTLAQKSGWVQAAALFSLMLVVFLLGIMRGSYIESSFIYQQF